MAVPVLWPLAFQDARVGTFEGVKCNIERLSRHGEIALREACILFALACCKGEATTKRIERLTSINLAAVSFTVDSLLAKGHLSYDRAGNVLTASISDSGWALINGCLSADAT